MNEPKIEKNVPMPAGYQKSSDRMELLQRMEIGDSVLLSQPAIAVREGYTNLAKRLGMQVVVRTTDQGTRMWRTK